MAASMKEEPSEVTEEMDALYEDVMENGVEMETIEIDDLLPSTDEPSCSSCPPEATTTPRRENTKLMTMNVRRSLKGLVVAPKYSARSMWPQTATSRIPSSGTAKLFTVVVPRRTPYDKHFQQREGEYVAKIGSLMQRRSSDRTQPDMTRVEQPVCAKTDDAIGAAKACAEATSSLQADADTSPAANGSNEASIEVDKGEPAGITTEAVQASTTEPDADMMPGHSNSDAIAGPTRPLEATSTAPGGRADRRKQQLNTRKNGNNVELDVLDEEQVVVLQRKKNRRYTLEEKLRVVEYAMQTSVRVAARDLGYNRKTVQDWYRHADSARRGEPPC
ncbi:hypothetical protein AAVH_10706 [Aphelenchoides avenae]|nr:hypothetical protein AAVH_10706 [Aphelenchus avenae]